MHTVFALLCFVVIMHWLIFPYPSGLLHWHCGNLTIAPVPAKQPWWIWIHTSCEFIMNDYITTTKQSTKKPCAYLLGYTVCNDTLFAAVLTPLTKLDEPRVRLSYAHFQCNMIATKSLPSDIWSFKKSSQYNPITNNQQEKFSMCCYSAVISRRIWQKRPSQSPRDILWFAWYMAWRNWKEHMCLCSFQSLKWSAHT